MGAILTINNPVDWDITGIKIKVANTRSISNYYQMNIKITYVTRNTHESYNKRQDSLTPSIHH